MARETPVPARGARGSPGSRYQLGARVGFGAYGEVYAGAIVGAGGFRREVAIKVLNRAPVADAARAELAAEAVLLGQLAHTNIVAAIDWTEIDGRPAIVMDWVPGVDLEQLIDGVAATGDRISPAAAFEIGRAVFDALHAGWSSPDATGAPLRIVHRDVKPSNVRLTPDGDVRVLDFGVARRRAIDDPGDAGPVGTPGYIPPEGAGTHAADVYSAAITVVELLLGERVGGLHNDATIAQMFAEVRARIGWPAEAARDAIDLLEAALDAAEARPSAAVLADALDVASRALPGERLRAFSRRVVPSLTRTSTAHTPSANQTLIPPYQPAVAARPGQRFAPLVAVALLAVGLAAMAAGLVGAVYALTGPLGGQRLVAELLAPPAPSPVGAAPTPAPQPTGEPAVDAVPALVTPFDAAPAAPVAPPSDPTPAPAPTRPTRRAAALASPAAPAASPPERVEGAPEALVDRAQFAAPDATAITVTCGPVTRAGTRSVRITAFPAGVCRVNVQYLGASYAAEVRVDRIGEVGCAITDGALSCGLR